MNFIIFIIVVISILFSMPTNIFTIFVAVFIGICFVTLNSIVDLAILNPLNKLGEKITKFFN